jgi:hypothetical protein
MPARRWPAPRGCARPAHAHDGHVERAAAEVEDQHGLRALDGQRVGEGGRDRCPEGHLRVTRQARGARQALLRARVVRGRARADEVHRAPEHDLLDRRAQRLLGAQARLAHEQRDQVLERVVARPHGRAAVAGLGEVALDRAEQPARLVLVDPDVDVFDEGADLGEGLLDLADPLRTRCTGRPRFCS